MTKSSANPVLGHRHCDPCNPVASSSFCMLPMSNSLFAQSGMMAAVSSACNVSAPPSFAGLLSAMKEFISQMFSDLMQISYNCLDYIDN